MFVFTIDCCKRWQNVETNVLSLNVLVLNSCTYINIYAKIHMYWLRPPFFFLKNPKLVQSSLRTKFDSLQFTWNGWPRQSCMLACPNVVTRNGQFFLKTLSKFWEKNYVSNSNLEKEWKVDLFSLTDFKLALPPPHPTLFTRQFISFLNTKTI